MFCKYCGTEINESAVVCTNCGIKTDNYEEKKPKLSVKIWHIVGSFILAIVMPFLGMICGLYLIWKEKTTTGAGVLVVSLICLLFYMMTSIQ